MKARKLAIALAIALAVVWRRSALPMCRSPRRCRRICGAVCLRQGCAAQPDDLGAKEAAKTVEERIEFDSPKGGRVAGLLIRPRTGEAVVILTLHGLGADKSFGRFFAALAGDGGYAVLSLDAALHGTGRSRERACSPATSRPRAMR